MCILSQLGSNLSILLVVELQRTDLLLQGLEDNEQSWNHKELQDSTNQHTTYGSSTKCLVTVLTYTAGKHHWQQTNNHGQRGHQDRTQTGGSTEHSRPRDSHTCLAALKGELNNQNGVLSQQTNQHDERNLHVDVVGVTKDHRKEETACQSERHGEYYGQRQDVRLVLCRQDEVDEDEAQQEDDTCGIRGLGLLTCQTRVVVGITSRQNLLTYLLDSLQCLAGRIAIGHCTCYVDRCEQVEAVDVQWAIYTLQVTELLNRRHA